MSLFAKTTEDIQGKLTGSVLDVLFTPAAFFWLAGFAVWQSAAPGRLSDLTTRLEKVSDLKILLGTATVLAVVAFSSAAYEPVNVWFLQRVAGYWGRLSGLGTPLRALLRRRVERANERNNDPKVTANLELASAVERTLHYYPPPNQVMITEYGCALVASDLHIYAKYGLSADKVWPALSCLLPDAARTAVADASDKIEASGRLLFWTFASIGWAWLAPGLAEKLFVIAAALLVALFAYVRLVAQGRAFADAYEAAFDVGRTALYKAMREQLPANPADEVQRGLELTDLLYRGMPESKKPFVDYHD